MAWAKLIIVIIQSVTSSGSLSHGLHDLTPAPYLHPKHQTPNPKYNPKWYHHEKQEGMQAYQNMRHSRPLVSEYTVYRNPYDVTGPRELDDAVRTQDEDVIVSVGGRLPENIFCPSPDFFKFEIVRESA